MVNTKKRNLILFTLTAAFMFFALALLGYTSFVSAADSSNVIVAIEDESGDFSTFKPLSDTLSTSENSPTKWTFGGAVPFKRPGLKFGSSAEQGGSAMTITLEINTNNVAEDGVYETVASDVANSAANFTEYFNESMPAGKYRMTVSAEPVTVGDTTYAKAQQSFYFLIEKQAMTVSGAPVSSTAWSIENNYAGVFNDFETKMTDDKFTLPSVTRTGFWNETDSARFFDVSNYTDYAWYQYKASGISDFIGASDEEWNGVITPVLGSDKSIAVNYRINLKNYVYTSTDTFDLTVNEEVEVPHLSNVPYNGTAIMPAFDSRKFTVAYNRSETVNFTDVGTYTLTLTLNNFAGGHVRWADGVGGETRTVSFAITKAQNSWSSIPSLDSWDWKNIQGDVIKRGVPRNGSADEVTYGIFTNESATDPVGSLSSFRIDASGNFLTFDGSWKIDSSVGLALGRIDAGTYYLKAVLADNHSNKNFGGLTSVVRFTVLPATNVWTQTPSVLSWIQGEFKSNSGLILGKSKYGTATLMIHPATERNKTQETALYIVTVDESGNRLITKGTAEVLNAQPSGVYSLTATVAKAGNYTGLSQLIEFKIISSGNMPNHWVTVPNIQGWVEGSTPNIPIALAAHGKVVYTYKKPGESISAETTTVPTAAGRYIMVARLEDTSGYDILEAEVEFTIAPKSFGWLKMPNIQGWHIGETPNKPSGSVTVIGIDVNFGYRAANSTLPAVADVPTKVGDYEMVATATYLGQTITAVIPFSITENPGAAVGGLTAGCIILGVLLAAVIGVGVFFFIRFRQANKLLIRRQSRGSNLNELKENARQNKSSSGPVDKDAIRERLRKRK